MWISWIWNLYDNLTNILKWKNEILPKAIKFRKLVTRTMGLEIHMQRHCDGSYVVVHFHVPTDDQNNNGGWKSSRSPKNKVKACVFGQSDSGWADDWPKLELFEANKGG